MCSIIRFEETNEEKVVWMETQDEYHEYLCTERSDNFLILLIPYAMQNKQDIMCEGLVTEEILYGLTEYLIPTL